MSYTLSKAEDDAGNAFFQTPQTQNDILADKGPSDNDQRHRLVVSGTLGDGSSAALRRALGGVQIGWVYAYGTALPFNVVTGADNNNDTTVNDRPAGVGRNSARMPCFADLTQTCGTSTFDMRISRALTFSTTNRIELMLEGFNLFNRANVVNVNNTIGNGPVPAADLSAGHRGRGHAPASIGGSMEFLVDARASAVVARRCPGASNATPSIAADGDFVAIAWGASTPAGATDVYTAVSRDGGRTFGPPVRVNDADGEARLNGEQPPRVALRGSAHHHRLDHERRRTAPGSCSRDPTIGGRTFAKATPVPGGDAAGNRGWENAVADRNGRVYAVWLDHRELAQQDGAIAATHHDHAAAASADAKPDGVAMAQRSKLYLGSLDGAVPPRADHRRRLLLLQDRARDGGRRRRLRRVAPRVSRQHPRHRLHLVARRRQDLRAAAAGQRGQVGPRRVSGRWPGDGRGREEPRPHRLADADRRRLARDPTIALFYAMSADGRRFTPRQADSHRGHAAPSADRDRRRRLADDRVG